MFLRITYSNIFEFYFFLYLRHQWTTWLQFLWLSLYEELKISSYRILTTRGVSHRVRIQPPTLKEGQMLFVALTALEKMLLSFNVKFFLPLTFGVKSIIQKAACYLFPIWVPKFFSVEDAIEVFTVILIKGL